MLATRMGGGMGGGMAARRRVKPVVSLPPQTWTPVVYNGVTNDPAYTFTNVAGSDGVDWNSGWDGTEVMAGNFLVEAYISGRLDHVFFGLRDSSQARGAGYQAGYAWWHVKSPTSLAAGSAFDVDVALGAPSGTMKLGIKRLGTSVEFYKDDALVNTFTNASFGGSFRLWGTMLWQTSKCRVIRWDALA